MRERRASNQPQAGAIKKRRAEVPVEEPMDCSSSESENGQRSSGLEIDERARPPRHPRVDTHLSQGHPQVGTSILPLRAEVNTPLPPRQPQMEALLPPQRTQVETPRPPCQPQVETLLPPQCAEVETPRPPLQPQVETQVLPLPVQVDTPRPPPYPQGETPRPPRQPQVETPFQPRHPQVGTPLPLHRPMMETPFQPRHPKVETLLPPQRARGNNLLPPGHPQIGTPVLQLPARVETLRPPTYPQGVTTLSPQCTQENTLLPSGHHQIGTPVLSLPVRVDTPLPPRHPQVETPLLSSHSQVETALLSSHPQVETPLLSGHPQVEIPLAQHHPQIETPVLPLPARIDSPIPLCPPQAATTVSSPHDRVDTLPPPRRPQVERATGESTYAICQMIQQLRSISTLSDANRISSYTTDRIIATAVPPENRNPHSVDQSNLAGPSTRRHMLPNQTVTSGNNDERQVNAPPLTGNARSQSNTVQDQHRGLLQCGMCRCWFLGLNALSFHMQNCQEQLLQNCSMCGARGFDRVQLRAHMLTVHVSTEAEDAIFLPVFDVRQKIIVDRLVALGSRHFIPLAQDDVQPGVLLAVPVIALDAARGVVMANLKGFGTNRVVQLGPMQSLN